MRKRIFTLLLALVAIASGAWAQETYNLWVGSVQVTSANASNVLGDGKVSYNSETSTLTFNNATITQSVVGNTLKDYHKVLIQSNGIDLNITGNVTIEGGDCSIYVLNGNLKLDGNITLEHYLLVDNGNLTIDSGVLKVNKSDTNTYNTNVYIECNGNISIGENVGKVETTGYIFSKGTITINSALTITEPVGAEIIDIDKYGYKDCICYKNTTTTAFGVVIEKVAKYNLWVGDTQVTDANKDDVLGDGKVTYNPETSTLTFNDATIEDYYTDPSGYHDQYIIYSKGIDLTINGKVALNNDNAKTTNSIYVVKDSGNGGKLTLNADITTNRQITSAGKLTVAGGSINFTASGINSWEDLTIKSDVTRIESQAGIYCGGQLIIEEPLSITYPVGGTISSISSGRVVIEKTATPYDLWIGGVQVTSANATDITAAINAVTANAASGTATYDSGTKTLTLNNFSYSGEGYSYEKPSYHWEYYWAGVFNKIDGLTIQLLGDNTITQTGLKKNPAGLLTRKADLSFSGNGTLKVTGANSTSVAKGISAEDCTITFPEYFTGTVSAIGGSCTGSDTWSVGLEHSFGVLLINGGTVAASGGNAVNSHGANSPTINGGNFTATGYTCAISGVPSLGPNVIAKGSTNIDGSNAVTYVNTDNKTYKWFESSKKEIVEPAVVDITVEPTSGDIAEAVATEAQTVTDAGNIVGDITINLAPDGNYTTSKAITASKNVTINGNGATIDASALTTPFIQMSETPAVEPVMSEEETPTVVSYPIDGITIKDVTITGLPYQLIYANKVRYLMAKVLVENSVIGVNGTAKKTIFDFNGGGNASELIINNSTLWADPSNAQNGGLFSSQSGQGSIQDLKSDKQLFAITNSTIYNIAYGKTTNSQRRNNTAGMEFKVENSVVVNSGKSGQFVVGLNGGSANSVQTYTISNNLFNFDGADVSAGEEAKVKEKIAEAALNSIEGTIAFTDPTAPDFSGTVLLAPSATAPSALGDPRWTLTYANALAINVAETENGTVSASPSAAAEGMTITLTATPAEGYELESITVKDADEAEVTVNDDNTFTMPAKDVTVTATFKKLPVDVNITVESGKDIAAEVETAADGAPVKSITVALEENGTYTIGKSLTAQGNVIINGAEGATIDASGLTAPFVQMADLPTEGLNELGAYEIDEVSFNDVTITGLKNQLFYANKQKYLITTLKVDNSVIGIDGTNKKTIFDFNSGGNCLNLTVNKSTLWANPSNAQNGGFYSSQSGQNVRQLKDGAEQVTTISNSTIYNIANGKTTSTRRTNSQDYIKYVVTNSIIAESGKSGQFLKGLNAGQAGKDSEWTVDGNTFIFDGAVIEEQTVGSTAENIKNSLESDPEFADAASGDFTVGESTEQAEFETGDPRWLVEFVGGEVDNSALLAEIEEAKKLLKYSMGYYDEHNEESPETEGKALVDAIREAEAQAEDGASQKKLDKTLEALKQAEIDYANALMDYELAESEDILADADTEADELAAELERLYNTQDVVREDYWNQPKNIKNYADELDKAQKAYLRKAINDLLPEAQAAAADNAEVQKAVDTAKKALEGDSSEDLFDALQNLLAAMETATGISSLEADEIDAPVYNMAGQRVGKNVKGIVIKNGKKYSRK